MTQRVRNVAGGPVHQSWDLVEIVSDPLERLECFGADVADWGCP
jgi:hypothetical protein